MVKAIGMFSGGLDSVLAVKLIKEQGIDVDVLHYNIGFDSMKLERRVKKKAFETTREELEDQLGVHIQDIDVTEEFLQLVLHPKYGYGSEMNPCIDCKVFLLRKAKEYMEAHQAKFIFTGEVVGQRPMSQQRPTLLQIEKAAGLSGYLLRPLSAKLLEPTIPEQEGWVDREKLLNIGGRGRSGQLALAKKFNLVYQQPAGGCLLNDPQFSIRLRDLIEHKAEADISTDDSGLLKFGRHLRLSDTLKIIVGRHEVDNDFLEKYSATRWTAEVRDLPGPLVLIDGEPSAEEFELIGKITAAYGKAKDAEQALVDFKKDGEELSLTVTPDATLNPNQWRIG